MIRLVVGDVVEYGTRKWYISAIFSDAVDNEDVDYEIVPIQMYFDGHATYYSFDKLGNEMIVNRRKLKESSIVLGELGFIHNLVF